MTDLEEVERGNWMIDGLTTEQLVKVREAVDWDNRKTLAEVYQNSGGKVDALDEATYSALIAVAQWGAASALVNEGGAH